MSNSVGATAFISFRKVWEDEHMFEMTIEANDGKNSVQVTVFSVQDKVSEAYNDLVAFKEQIHGGLVDISFGFFGPEYANGAFYGRFHFADNQRGRILISLRMQSSFFDFGRKNVAANAELYLLTEPALFDDFVESFPSLNKVSGAECRLECVEF